jgi:hypothetical protein
MSEQLVPIHRTVIIPDVLSVILYQDEIGLGLDSQGGSAPSTPAWVFASHGLETFGQRELVLVILKTAPLSPPQSPNELVSTVYQQARAGTVLQEGNVLEVRGANIDFDPRVSGFMFLHYATYDPRLPAIEVDMYRKSPLLVLPVLPDEIQAADMFGNSRIVALLAKDSRSHPFPWWHDARRNSVVSVSGPPSILADLRIPRANTPYVEVVQTGPHLDIIVTTEERSRLHELFTTAPDSFVLLTGVASESLARYFWEPGQTQPAATWRTQGTKDVIHGDLPVAGNFLMLLHGEIKNSTQLSEDGFIVMMAEPTWRLFIAALKEQKPFTCRTRGERISEVSLQFREYRYVSPFGRTYQTVSGGAFNIYRPSPGAKSHVGMSELQNVEVQQIQLLTAQNEIFQAISTEALGDYISEACAVIDDAMEGVVHCGEEFFVQFRLAPNSQPLVQLAVRADDPQAFPSQTAQLLVDRLNSLPAPAVTQHEVRLEVRLTFPPNHIARTAH